MNMRMAIIARAIPIN